jgi:hypothetical protein
MVDRHRVRRWVSPYFVGDTDMTVAGLNGILLVTAVIVAASIHGGTLVSVLAVTVVTVLVFWAAHVYASMLVLYAREGHTVAGAARHAAREELGMLQAVLPPLAILSAGVLGILEGPTAVWLALWSGVLVLTVIPVLALRRRGRPWMPSLLAGVGSGALGMVLIGLKALVH